MNKQTYGLANSSIVAIIAGLVEMCKNAYEFQEKGLPHGYFNIGLNIIAIVASLYAVQEIRHRMRILARRSVLAAIVNLGFWATCAAVHPVLVRYLALSRVAGTLPNWAAGCVF